MTQINPNAIEVQKVASKTVAPVAPAKRRRLSKDEVRQAPKAPVVVKGKGVVTDPLANLPAGKEQASGGGEYYPPAGMPGVYYMMKALLLDLKAGLHIAHIDNDIMAQQYKSWAEALDTFAKKSKEVYDQQAREALWSGISSTVSAVGSLISITGSGFNLYKSESDLKGLTEEKSLLNGRRFEKDLGELKEVKAPKANDVESKLIINQEENATELTTFKDSSEESVGMNVSSEEVKGALSRLEDLDPDWKVDDKEPLDIQRQKILKEKTLVQKAQEGETDEKTLKDLEGKQNIYNKRLELVGEADKDLETQVKAIEDKIAAKTKKSQHIGDMLTQFGYLANTAQQVVSGFSKATISTAQGQADYDKNMADKLKSLKQMVTQGYEQQTNKEYQTIDQLLSTIEGTIAKLYAAQQSGSA